MSQPSLFDMAADRLDDLTDLSRLESRGTLRIILKKAGFDARNVSASDLGVVLEKLLPEELVARGIDDAENVVRRLIEGLAKAPAAGDTQETPDAVFRRFTS
ncbi:MAG: hypothetical protein AB8G23_11865 [Myxococcota bacterium]